MLQPLLIRADDSRPALLGKLPQTSQDSHLPAILGLLKDKNFSASEVLHLIDGEVLRVIRAMEERRTQPPKHFKLSTRMTQIRALRELVVSVQRTDRFRQSADVPDLDGPRFSSVFDKILDHVGSRFGMSSGKAVRSRPKAP